MLKGVRHSIALSTEEYRDSDVFKERQLVEVELGGEAQLPNSTSRFFRIHCEEWDSLGREVSKNYINLPEKTAAGLAAVLLLTRDRPEKWIVKNELIHQIAETMTFFYQKPTPLHVVEDAIAAGQERGWIEDSKGIPDLSRPSIRITE